MRILTRYLLRAHVGPFLFAFVALTGVVLINTLARRLADLAGKGLPLDVVMEFFVLALPATVALTFPMAVLVAVLYTFSQFTAENEVTALKASGVDLRRMLAPLLLSALLIAVFMVWFNDRVLPEANHRWSTLWSDIARKTPTLVLQEQTINRITSSDGRTLYIRSSRIDPATNRLWDVALYDVSSPEMARTIYADSGVAMFSASQTDLVLRLYDGHIRQVGMGDPSEFQRIAFREQVLGMPGVGTALNLSDQGGYRGDREMTIAMLQGRVDSLRAQRHAAREEAQESALLEMARVIPGEAVERQPGDPLDLRPVALRTQQAAESLRAIHGRVEDLERRIREYEVEIQKKYSIAAATLVFVLIGAPLALRFPAGGIGMVIATSLIVFSLYYVGLIGGEALADRGVLTPVFAMWVVNGLMTVLGLLGLMRMGRETSTARGGGITLAGLASGVAEWARRRRTPEAAA